MEIKTKFSIGDKVWTIKVCKALEFEVCSISISKSTTLYPANRITYCGEYKDGKITTAEESECFATREELIKYISDDGNQNL